MRRANSGRGRVSFHTLVLLLLLFLFGCGRPQETQEVKKLREEVKTLSAKLEQQTNAPMPGATSVLSGPIAKPQNHRPENTPPPQELLEFMRVSRGMIAALDTAQASTNPNLAYSDLGLRLVDVKASAEEVIPKVNPDQRTNISNFVGALSDGYNLWGYSLLTDAAKMRLTRYADNQYRPNPYATTLGERWNEDFQQRVDAYHLREKRTEPKSEPVKPSKPLTSEEQARVIQDAFAQSISQAGADVGLYDPGTGLLAGSPPSAKSDSFAAPITDLKEYSVLDYERTCRRIFYCAEKLFREIETSKSEP